MVATKVLIVLIAANTFKTDAHVAEALTAGTSASYVVGALVGHAALRRRIGSLAFRRVGRTVAQIASASVVGAVAAGLIALASQSAFGHGHAGAAVGLVGGGVIGLALIAAVAWRIRIPEIRDLVRLARERESARP
jgi:putative peptidoglycan lipid II flippase